MTASQQAEATTSAPAPWWNQASSIFRREPLNNEVAPPLDASVEVLAAPDSGAAVMVRCSDCHHLVPQTNLEIHQATACKRPSRDLEEPNSTPPSSQQQTNTPMPTTQEATATVPASTPWWNKVTSIFRCEPPASDFPSTRNRAGNREGIENWQMVDRGARHQEWECRQCTFLSPTTSERCSVCNASRQQSEADAAPREEQQRPSQQFNPIPGLLIGGGAVVGCVLGGAFGALTGNPLGGAVEGAMNGVVCGTLVAAQHQAPIAQEQARREHMHLLSQQQSHGVPQTRVRYPDGTVRIFRGDVPVQMLHASENTNATNRGADERLIASIPTTRIQDETTKCDDKCAICLDGFKKGSSCKTLPCMHAFHGPCVDKWLRTNASCPMCKHSISS